MSAARCLALPLLLTALAASARAQPIAADCGPVSATAERAMRLHDAESFLAASIELNEVVQQQTGDVPCVVQRAEHLLGKTLVYLGLPAVALRYFTPPVAAGPSHPYFDAAMAEIDALARARPATRMGMPLEPDQLDALPPAVPQLAELARSPGTDERLGDLSSTGLAVLARAAVCPRGATDDLASASAAARDELRVLAHGVLDDDDTIVYERFTETRRRAASRATSILELTIAAHPPIAERLLWIEELAIELEHVQRIDRAWQTTAIAADVLDELTIAQALAQAETGKLLRDALGRLVDDAAVLDGLTRAGARPISAGPRGDVVVPASACGPGDLQAIAVAPPGGKHGGCAGCASADPRGHAFVALLVALGLTRRGRRARAS